MLIFKDTSLLLLWCSLPPGVCGVVVVLMMLCEEREAGRRRQNCFMSDWTSSRVACPSFNAIYIYNLIHKSFFHYKPFLIRILIPCSIFRTISFFILCFGWHNSRTPWFHVELMYTLPQKEVIWLLTSLLGACLIWSDKNLIK